MSSVPGRIKNLSLNQKIIGGGVVVLVIGLLAGLLVGVVFKSKKTPTASSITAPHGAPAAITTLCPLTDVPIAGGAPNRPAVAVKIGNEPGPSRPQSGLNEADVIYDTPAEGFIMRYVAVFQCNNAPSIGPIRSVRWVDWHITQDLGNPILAFAGGIDPDVNTVMALPWLHPANLLEGGQAAGHRISSRSAPDNLFTSTSALYALYKTATGVPKPIFSFSPNFVSGAVKTTGLGINYSGGTDIRWTWDTKSHSWLHGYTGTGADVDNSTGARVSTTNIVVESVTYTFGPYSESPGGSGDVESNTLGSGPGYILRNGKSIAITWHRSNLADPMTYTDAAGNSVSLAPGRTWVELVPDSTFRAKGAVTLTH